MTHAPLARGCGLEGPGVVELARDPGTGVVSAWLASGVRVHAMTMSEANQVRISALLAGGEMLETPDARGVASLVSAALGRGTHGRVPAVDVDAALAQRGVSVTCFVMRDAIRLDLAGPPSELEWMLELLAGLLREPRIDPAAARAWRQAYGTIQGNAAKEPMLRLHQLLLPAIMQGHDGTGNPGCRTFEHLDAELASAWTRALIVEAPTSVAIVGPSAWGEALAAAERTLARLPARERIAPGVREPAAKAAPLAGNSPNDPPAPPARLGMLGKTHTERIDGAGRSAVLVGFEAPGMHDLRDLRAVTLAREVLGERVASRLSEPEQKQHAWAILMPGESPWALGVFAIIVSTPSDRADQMVGLMQVELARFAGEGPTPDELAAAKRDIDRRLLHQLASPAHWAARLSALPYRGQRIEDVTGARSAYESVTAAEVRDTFRAWMARGSARIAPAIPGDHDGLLVVQVIGVEADD